MYINIYIYTIGWFQTSIAGLFHLNKKHHRVGSNLHLATNKKGVVAVVPSLKIRRSRYPKGNAFNPSNPWLRSAYSALGASFFVFFSDGLGGVKGMIEIPS